MGDFIAVVFNNLILKLITWLQEIGYFCHLTHEYKEFCYDLSEWTD